MRSLIHIALAIVVAAPACFCPLIDSLGCDHHRHHAAEEQESCPASSISTPDPCPHAPASCEHAPQDSRQAPPPSTLEITPAFSPLFFLLARQESLTATRPEMTKLISRAPPPGGDGTGRRALALRCSFLL